MNVKWGTCSILAVLLLMGCMGPDRQDPLVPGNPGEASSASSQTAGSFSNRYLWGTWRVQVDPTAQTAIVSPDRSADMHLNVVKLLEVSACEDCLKISNVKLTSPHELSLDVTLKHPFANSLDLTAFDVRGVFIADGDSVNYEGDEVMALGDGVPRMLNPDGYTRLFNPTKYPPGLPSPPALKYYQGKYSNSSDLTATVNPFLAFSQDIPRRMFLPGTQETKTMKLHVPGGPFKFGYAVDASWMNPGKTVVDPEEDFPITANCPEAYKISVTVGDGLDEWTQSSTQIKIEIFDHQASLSGPDDWFYSFDFIEGFGAFDYSIVDGPVVTGQDSVQFTGKFTNKFGSKAGVHPFFVQVLSGSDPNFGWVWAFQPAQVLVKPMPEYAPIVKADAYPKLQVVGVPVQFWDSGTMDPDKDTLVKWEWDWNDDGTYDAEGKDIFHTFDSPGDYEVTLRVTDSDSQVGVLQTPLAIHVKSSQGWARTWGAGSNYGDSVWAVTTDESGNVYAAGDFCGEGDFDPGPGDAIYYSTGTWDGFLSKFDQDGNFLWVKIFHVIHGVTYSTVHPTSLLVDNKGSIYMGGWFHPDADFDPGPGEDIHMQNGYGDAFLVKLTINGEFQWCRTWGGIGIDSVHSLAVGPVGDIWAGGLFAETVDFDPGPGEDIHVSNGSTDAFLAEFDSSGNFLWAGTWGSSLDMPMHLTSDSVSAIAADSTGNIYVSGATYPGYPDPEPIDYDPGPGVDLLGAGDFLSKFDYSGNYQWAKVWSASAEGGIEIRAIDAAQDNILYLTGDYYGLLDFDPGPGEEIHEDNGGGDVYLEKLDSDANFIWVRTWGSDVEWYGDDYGYDCATDSLGNVYVTGTYGGTVDFDPGPGVVEHWAKQPDCEGPDFISKFNASGDFFWVNVWGISCGADQWVSAWAVAVGPGDVAYVVGTFLGTVDFDPGPGEDLHSANPYYSADDCYLTKFPPDGVW